YNHNYESKVGAVASAFFVLPQLETAFFPVFSIRSVSIKSGIIQAWRCISTASRIHPNYHPPSTIATVKK
ncbi:MAG: hypothetical protein P1U56_17625, partial [Saprospiraceae bacterium]|nr:hypothetical protein [Saprospiraceae bacterium]